MADKKRRGGGSDLVRSETVTVRLDPKLRYLASLAARKQRRTLSSFIEWSIEETLKQVVLGNYDPNEKGELSVADQAETLWDVDEADRFVKLAANHPEMLNHHEQVVWKLVRESGYLWRGRKDKSGTWQWKTKLQSMKFEELRETWELLNKVAADEEDRSKLPNWPGMPPSLFNDDIEF